MRLILLGSCAVGLILLAPASGFGKSAGSAGLSGKVFQVGKFDRSSGEFAGGNPEQAVDFIVGKSAADKDWYAFQPSVLASAAPGAVAAADGPRKISFKLAEKPARFYTLHVAVLIESPSVPALRLTINGKHGLFFLHPRLDLSGGDVKDAFDPAYSHADIVFRFPGSYLHKGINALSLQAIEEAAREVPDAGIRYDAISLSKSAAAPRESEAQALIVPTIFYQRAPTGLDELVDVYIRFEGRPQAGADVDLAIDGKHYRKTVTGNEDFGEEKFEYSAPEFETPTDAVLAWVSSGRRHHLKEIIRPGKKWTLFLIPHIHLDVGYSDFQAKVAAIQSRAFDESMDFSQEDPGFCFSTDGEWNLQQFWKTRTNADRQRLVTAIRKRRIFIPAQYANLLTGFASAETLIRSLYPSADFSRLHGTPFNYANETDVPSYTWSYPSILASAGIKYFLAGSDNYRAPVLLQGRLQYKSPMWWVGPDGKKVIFWYSRLYQQMRQLFGLPPLVAAAHDTLPLFLQMYDDASYRANATIIFGSQQENTDLFPQQATMASRWNAIYAFPRMEYSGIHHALKTIVQQFDWRLPTITGDGGPYWADGIASDAYYAAIERGNESRGPSAEKLETLASLTNPNITPDREDLRRMWQNMVLMDEHTFTSHNSVTQPKSYLATRQLKIKNRHATDARFLADWMARNSMASIVNSISAGRNSLVVFNMLNWRRSGFVTVDLPDGDEIVDETTGKVVPFEVLLDGHGFDRIRFLAANVPAVGYKTYFRRAASYPQAELETSTSTTMESPYYRVVLDPSSGAIKSIFDKQLHRQLVNTASPYRFGEYLYVTGGDHAPNSLLQYRPVSPKPALTIHPARDGSLLQVRQTPYGWVAEMKSVDTETPEITTEVRLFNHEKKIELVEDVDKKYVTTKEGVYFAFPFAMDHPEFQYEIQNGVVNPARNMYPGAGHEWFSVQHWVSIQQDGLSGTVMPLDASLVTLGDINRGAWPATFGSRPGTIFSYVMNNYWNTNYVAGQGGHFRFRYVITSAPATDPEQLSRMGWEEMTPLEWDEVTSQDKALNTPRPLSGEQGSFLTVSDPNIVLDTWKPAENGQGTILRFIDMGGPERSVTVHTPLLDITGAWLTDAVERNQKQLPLVGTNGFSFTTHPHEIITIRLIGGMVIKGEPD